jgi:RecJ-like exonuclease
LVKIVGQVIQQQQQSTNISYSIDDGTGMIVAQQFGDHEHESFDQAYVQVYGQLRSFQQKKVVNVSKIIKLHSLDQVTLHFLDVIRYKVKPVTQNAQPVKSTVTLESQIIQFFMDTRDTTNGGNINNLIMSLRGVASEAEIRYIPLI